MNQYLKDIESQIETEEELAEKKTLVDKVLDRLITHVSIMLLYSTWINLLLVGTCFFMDKQSSLWACVQEQEHDD